MLCGQRCEVCHILGICDTVVLNSVRWLYGDRCIDGGTDTERGTGGDSHIMYIRTYVSTQSHHLLLQDVTSYYYKALAMVPFEGGSRLWSI